MGIFQNSPNGPNIKKQLVIILSTWAISKWWINRPKSGGNSGGVKIYKPKIPICH